MSGLFRFLTAGESHGEALVVATAPETRRDYDTCLASLKTW